MYQQASPIEQAYSIYLAQQIFDNDCNNALISIHISGRDAVPFLTQSGIDRSVLKTIWNVSDPQNVGSLTSINQFWLLLRLISLAQAGIVQSQHSNSDMNALLAQYSRQKMSLPVFSTVMMPKPTKLMSMYGHLVVSAAGSTIKENTSTNATTQSLGDVFGGLVEVEDAQLSGLSGLKSDNSSNNNYSIPSMAQDSEPAETFQGPGNVQRISQMMTSTLSSPSDVSSNCYGDGQQQQPLQQQQQVPAISDIIATTTGPVSVSDSFSDFGLTCNAPLPALNSQTQSISTKERDENDDDDDFCDFSSDIQNAPPSSHDDVTSFTDIMQAVTTTSYTGKTTETSKTQVSSSAFNVSDDDNDEDNFGQFGSAINTDSTNQQHQPFVTNFSQALSEPAALSTKIGISNISTVSDSGQSLSLDPFGDLAPVENAPLPSLNVFARGVDKNNHLPAPSTTAEAATSASTLSADMSVQHDALSPSLEITNETNREDQNNDIDDDDHDNDIDDGFSNFQMATATTTAAKMTITALSAEETNHSLDSSSDIFGFGTESDSFSGRDMTEISRSLSITDAFGDMPDRDIPLPSLEMMKETNTEDQNRDSEEKAKNKIESDDALRISTPQMDVTESGRSSSITDAFDDFPVQQDAPLPSYEIMKETNTEDQNKDNEEEDEGITEPDVAFLTSSPQMDVTETGNYIQAQQNNLLSSLEMLNEAKTENQIKKNDTDEGRNDDDDEMFGMFEEAVESSVAPDSFFESHVQQNDTRCEFPVMARVSQSKSEFSQVDPLVIKDVSRSLSITDAFGDMPIKDSPLPSLNVTTIPIAEPNGNHDHELDNNVKPTSESNLPVTESSAIRSAISATGDATENGSAFLSSNESIPKPVTVDNDIFGNFSSAEVITASTSAKGEAENKEDGSALAAVEYFVPTNDRIDDSGSDDAEPEAPVEDNGQGYNCFAEVQNPCPDVGSDGESWGDFDEATTIEHQLPVDDTRKYDNSLFNLDKAAPKLQLEPKVPVEDTLQGINNLSFLYKAAPNLQYEPALNPSDDAGIDKLDESWGDFDEAPIIEPQVLGEDTGESDNNLLDLEAPPNFQSEKAQILSNESWGDFDEAPTIEPLTPVVNNGEGDNNLFDLEKAAPNLQSEQAPNPSSDTGSDKFDESWGDFDEAPTIEPLTPVVDTGEGDKNLFDLDKTAPSLQSKKSQNPSPDADCDGDFVNREQFNIATSSESEKFKGLEEEDIGRSNFANLGSDDGDEDWISSQSTEIKFPEEVKNRDRIRSLALQLPECLLRKSGVSGEHVDLGEAYEVNIGIKSTLDKSRKRREERCVEALESLTSTENSKLASMFWVQIFEVVNEELDNAMSLLDDAEFLSPGEWNEVQAPFSVMLRGLAEYMRVTRSIVSSIGDVLLLDESSMLTVDTWASTWCSLSVLEKALDCEKTWKNINKQLIKTPLAAVTAASIEEIRSHSKDSSCGNPGTSTLCHLTLQPLRDEDKGTTKAGTSFQGKEFMSCAANFLIHKCPFFVVGEEI